MTKGEQSAIWSMPVSEDEVEFSRTDGEKLKQALNEPHCILVFFYMELDQLIEQWQYWRKHGDSEDDDDEDDEEDESMSGLSESDEHRLSRSTQLILMRDGLLAKMKMCLSRLMQMSQDDEETRRLAQFPVHPTFFYAFTKWSHCLSNFFLNINPFMPDSVYYHSANPSFQSPYNIGLLFVISVIIESGFTSFACVNWL